MSHEVLEYDNPAYAKKPAWHGLGIVIPEGDLWKMDADHVLGTGSMDFDVELVPSCARWFDDAGKEHVIEIPGCFLTRRMDLAPDNPASYLGQVGDQYRAIQNRDMRDFAVALSENAKMQFETAGTLRNGKLAWMLARTSEIIKVMDDQLLDFILQGLFERICSPGLECMWEFYRHQFLFLAGSVCRHKG